MIRQQFNQKNNKFKDYEVDSSTQTVPDQTLSIRDLLDRHSRGLPLGTNTKTGEYFDTEIPRFDDITDMIKWKKELMSKNTEINKLIRKEQKKSETDKQQAQAPENNPRTEIDDL